MITEQDAEKAVDYLRSNALKAAQARGERIYVEEYRKVVKAQLMREVGTQNLGNQETYAYADPRYLEHLKAIKEAVTADEYHKWMMCAAEAKLEAYRTQCANERALGKLG